MSSRNEIIDSLWERSYHGTRREDIEAAYEAGRNAAIAESVERGWIGPQYADDYCAAMRSTAEADVDADAPVSPLSPEYKAAQKTMNKAAIDLLNTIAARPDGVPFDQIDIKIVEGRLNVDFIYQGKPMFNIHHDRFSQGDVFHVRNLHGAIPVKLMEG